MKYTHGSARRLRLAAWIATALALAAAGPAPAQLRDLRASVIWSAGSRAYLAAADSGAFEPGMRIELLEGNRVVASGDIVRVVDGSLGVMQITSGSLERTKKLGRLRVLAELAPAPPVHVLRVGLPSGARSNLVLACDATAARVPQPPAAYRAEALTADAYRWIRSGSAPADTSWPDTLLVRLFAESADEEIALERGELDVAVFWPGELSAHLRESPQGASALLGIRSRGVIVAIESPGAQDVKPSRARTDPNYVALNAQMFRSDLLPWSERDSEGPAVTGSAASSYAVDPSLPGQRVLARFLNQGARPTTSGANVASQLAYADAALGTRDSLKAAWSERGIAPLYLIRCAVVCAPERRSYVESLGADAFADLPVCSTPRRP